MGHWFLRPACMPKFQHTRRKTKKSGTRGGTRTRRTLVLSQVRLPITSLAQKHGLERWFRFTDASCATTALPTELSQEKICLVPRAGIEPAQAFGMGLSVLQETSPYLATPPPGTRNTVAIYRFSIGSKNWWMCGELNPGGPRIGWLLCVDAPTATNRACAIFLIHTHYPGAIGWIRTSKRTSPFPG